MFLEYAFMQKALIGSVCGGVCFGVVGVLVIFLGMPFIGVVLSHAAFAGAAVGLLFNINPVIMGLFFCVITATIVGPLSDYAELEVNESLGVLFSVFLGIAFLAIGLLGNAKSEASAIMWGNILTISFSELIALILTMIVIIAFVMFFFRKIRAVLFHREIAESVGIPTRVLIYAMLLVSALCISLEIKSLGGLLVFALIINPAASAYQLTYNLKYMFIFSSIFAVCATLGGLLISSFLNLPTGAVTVLCSSIIFACALIFSPKRSYYEKFENFEKA